MSGASYCSSNNAVASMDRHHHEPEPAGWPEEEKVVPSWSNWSYSYMQKALDQGAKHNLTENDVNFRPKFNAIYQVG